jgi:hypothetical protein
MEQRGQPDIERIRQLAARLAAADPGPAGELATELAGAVAALSDRMDALWQLISAVVESAGLSMPTVSAPPAEFVEALDTARRTGRRDVRLSIDGKEWVAALGQQPPAADPASWSAIQRLTRESADHDDM